MKKYAHLLHSPQNIIALIALLGSFFYKEVGLDQYLSATLSASIVGAVLAFLAIQLKDKWFEKQARNILLPVTEEFLKDVEVALESRYHVEIPDSLKGEILEAIYGHIETDGF